MGADGGRPSACEKPQVMRMAGGSADPPVVLCNYAIWIAETKKLLDAALALSLILGQVSIAAHER